MKINVTSFQASQFVGFKVGIPDAFLCGFYHALSALVQCLALSGLMAKGK